MDGEDFGKPLARNPVAENFSVVWNPGRAVAVGERG